MNLADDYYNSLGKITATVYEKNQDTLKELGTVIADRLAMEASFIHLVVGHSGIIAQELIHRAGGLVPVSAIIDPTRWLG